jgi:hypothetical protein
MNILGAFQSLGKCWSVGFQVSMLWANPFRSLLHGSVTATFGLSVSLSTSLFSYQSPAQQIDVAQSVTNPPCIDEIIARRTFADNSQAYFWIRYSAGNFLVKSTSKRELARPGVITLGDEICGRVNRTLWVVHDATQRHAWIADSSASASTNRTVVDHEKMTAFLADHVSRLGRALLSFGIEMPLDAKTLAQDGGFSFQDDDYEVTCKIAFKRAQATGLLPFEVTWQRELLPATNRIKEVYEIRGEYDLQNRIPKWYDIFEFHNSDGTKAAVGRVEVLEVKLCTTALPSDWFSMEQNVKGGLAGVLVRQGDRLANKVLGEVAGGSNMVSIGKYLVPVTFVRIVVISLLVAVSVAFAVTSLKKTVKK